MTENLIHSKGDRLALMEKKNQLYCTLRECWLRLGAAAAQGNIKQLSDRQVTLQVNKAIK